MICALLMSKKPLHQDGWMDNSKRHQTFVSQHLIPFQVWCLLLFRHQGRKIVVVVRHGVEFSDDVRSRHCLDLSQVFVHTVSDASLCGSVPAGAPPWRVVLGG